MESSETTIEVFVELLLISRQIRVNIRSAVTRYRAGSERSSNRPEEHSRRSRGLGNDWLLPGWPVAGLVPVFATIETGGRSKRWLAANARVCTSSARAIHSSGCARAFSSAAIPRRRNRDTHVRSAANPPGGWLVTDRSRCQTRRSTRFHCDVLSWLSL